MFRIFIVIYLIGCCFTGKAQQDINEGDWIEVNPEAPWAARAGLQAVYFKESLYIMGGRTPSPPSDPIIPGESTIWGDVWRSDDLGATWQQIHTTDTTGNSWPARAYFQAVTLEDHIYILGGQNFKTVPNPDCDPPFNNCSPFISTSDFFNDVWRSTDGINWELMTDSAGWSGRAGFSCVTYNDELFVMSGSINDDAAIIGGPPSRIYLNDVWKSSDGATWTRLLENAPWEERAGGIAVVKDDYIYLVGGEEGFICLPGTPCPPYFNDVWRTRDGIDWEEINPASAWKKRPGHQVVVLEDKMVLFGGFGLSENLFDPFAPANPRDVWTSDDGSEWTRISRRPWNTLSQADVKYDFDAISFVDPQTGQDVAFTFGGDRETFDFTDPLNYLNVDNDVWKLCLSECEVLSSSAAIPLGAVELFPMPVQDRLHLTVPPDWTGELDIVLYDMRGIRLIRERRQLQAGQEPFTLDMEGLPRGQYMLQIRHRNSFRTFPVNK